MNWRASLKAAAVGTMSGTAIGLIAFSFLTSHQHPSMGAVLFLLVPVAAGFSIVLVARTPNSAVAAVISIVFSSFARLGKEGVLCALLAFPIIVAGLGIGAGIGILVRRLFVDRSKNQTTTTGILLLIGPTLIVAGERIERPILQHSRTEVVQTTAEVNEKPEEAWGRILSIDSVQASKPILNVPWFTYSPTLHNAGPRNRREAHLLLQCGLYRRDCDRMEPTLLLRTFY